MLTGIHLLPGDKKLISDNLKIASSDMVPPLMTQSRAKIWIRTGILAVFATLFGLKLYTDIVSGMFHALWALMALLLCLPIGFWLRKLVPMQVHPASRHVTLSFDRVYFTLIVILVMVKVVAGKTIFSTTNVADVVMCMILGLMAGRLSGICIRVHNLKQSGFEVNRT
jgi:hypothetical protein